MGEGERGGVGGEGGGAYPYLMRALVNGPWTTHPVRDGGGGEGRSSVTSQGGCVCSFYA